MAERVTISFLGGLGEIGRNCACFELGGRIVVLDCGVMFPDPDMPGIDLVLPDLSYLRERADSVDAVVLTHGHEDHTGGLAYLLRDLSTEVIGSELTLGLARHRVEEAGLVDRARFSVVNDGDRRKVGPFEVEFIPVTHSVPNGFATAFHTPQGVVLHTGDFKLDLTPVDGRRTDLARIGALADDPGIRLLLSDSTNAVEPGFSESERSVGAVLRKVFSARPGKRMIVACFASHIHRVQQIFDAAASTGRRVATLGRSMRKNVDLAERIGLLSVPAGLLVDIEEVDRLSDGEVCVVCTGSQGEPLSALALLATGENKWLTLGSGDVVVISAHPIPGNEWAVGRVVDGLYRRGAEVVDTNVEAVHVSGHARQGELQTMLSVARPEWFVPVHGEFRHLRNHGALAEQMGVKPENILVCQDGDSVSLKDQGLSISGGVPAGYLFVDGTVGDIGNEVLRDRRVLAEEGVVVVVATVDLHDRELVGDPEIVTRGWVHGPEADALVEEAGALVRKSLEAALSEENPDHDALVRNARRTVGRFVGERTRRRPMIVPLIVCI